MAQYTQLILTLVHSLGSWNYLRCDLAAQLLMMICEEPGLRKEQVRQGGRGSLQTMCTCPCEHVPYAIIHMWSQRQRAISLAAYECDPNVLLASYLCPEDSWPTFCCLMGGLWERAHLTVLQFDLVN